MPAARELHAGRDLQLNVRRALECVPAAHGGCERLDRLRRDLPRRLCEPRFLTVELERPLPERRVSALLDVAKNPGHVAHVTGASVAKEASASSAGQYKWYGQASSAKHPAASGVSAARSPASPGGSGARPVV